MREIKFRVWDNNNKLMIMQDETDRVDKCLSYFETHIKTTLMQYTGLKDKNGVDIYEGDIVKAYNYLTKDGKTFFDDIDEIKFDEKRAMFMYGTDYLHSVIKCDCEVIGNIYENKELLNGN